MKGDQSRPENYCPLCDLSHSRKIIDAAVLMKVNVEFTPTMVRNGFQPGISVQQAISTADRNARKGMSQLAVLDLEKAYDGVDIRTILHVATKWLHLELLKMVRCLLGPLSILTKCEPTHLHVQVKRRVPQGARSSHVLLNMYIDDLGDEILANARIGNEEGTTVIIAYDVLLQESSSEKLQNVLHCDTSWRGRCDASWSTEKSAYVTQAAESDRIRVYLDGNLFRMARMERYLGISLTKRGVIDTIYTKRREDADRAVTTLTQKS